MSKLYDFALKVIKLYSRKEMERISNFQMITLSPDKLYWKFKITWLFHDRKSELTPRPPNSLQQFPLPAAITLPGQFL